MTRAATKLEPCPWCGSEAVVMHSTIDDAWRVFCGSARVGVQCDASPHLWGRTKAKGIAAWNRRVTPEQPR